MKGAGSDVKLPAGSPDTVMVAGETLTAAPPPSPPSVECVTCAYFTPLHGSSPEGVVYEGDGHCYAEPPGMATMQGTHKLTHRPVVILTAARPLVKNADFCRRWRESETFEGDAEIAQGEALETIADALDKVAHYLREMVHTGKDG